MLAGACKRMHVAARAFRAWPIWDLPHGLATFIIVTTAVYAAALGWAASTAHVDPWDLFLFAALMLCIATTVELTKRAGENAGVVKDVYAVWELPIAILLPPVFVLVAPLIQIGLTQWRIRRIPVHRRVFAAAAVGLSYGLASVGFHAIARLVPGPGVLVNPGRYSHAQVAGWLLAVAAAGVLQWAANLALVLPAIKASDPCLRMRDMIFDRERVQNDVAELSVAVLVTLRHSDQPDHDRVRVAVRDPAPALDAACPAAECLPHRLQDGAAQRGDLGARSRLRGRPGGPHPQPSGPGPDRCRSFQDRQRPAWSSRRG